MIIYQLEAKFEEVFLGGKDRIITKVSNPVFLDKEIAESWILSFNNNIRKIFKTDKDYPITITIIEHEVIEDKYEEKIYS